MQPGRQTRKRISGPKRQGNNSTGATFPRSALSSTRLFALHPSPYQLPMRPYTAVQPRKTLSLVARDTPARALGIGLFAYLPACFALNIQTARKLFLDSKPQPPSQVRRVPEAQAALALLRHEYVESGTRSRSAGTASLRLSAVLLGVWHSDAPGFAPKPPFDGSSFCATRTRPPSLLV